ncbi:MAG: transposase [Acidobacteriaceae bacterium]
MQRRRQGARRKPRQNRQPKAQRRPQPNNSLNRTPRGACKTGSAFNWFIARNYQPHIKQRKEEADAKRYQPGWKARRWGAERTHSWLNRYRKLLVSFEKTEASYVALLSLAAALICSGRRPHLFTDKLLLKVTLALIP